MEKYMNGGIMKEITVYLRSREDAPEMFSFLGDLIDLDLYEVTTYENSYYFDLKEELLRKYIVSFLEELNQSGIYEEVEFFDKITSVQESLKNEKYECVLENCDEIFKDRYRMTDCFSIYDERFAIDILYYAFYFDGPFGTGEYNRLLKYMHTLNQRALTNPLKGSICFGLN